MASPHRLELVEAGLANERRSFLRGFIESFLVDCFFFIVFNNDIESY